MYVIRSDRESYMTFESTTIKFTTQSLFDFLIIVYIKNEMSKGARRQEPQIY